MITNSNKKQHERGATRLRKAPGRGTSTAGEERSVGLINHARMSLRVMEKDDVSFLMNSTWLLLFFDQAASAYFPSLCPIHFARRLAETPCATRLKNTVFALCINALFRYDVLLYFMNQGCLADTGVSSHREKLRLLCDSAIENGLKVLYLGLATVELLGDLQATGKIITSQLERFKSAFALPLLETALEVIEGDYRLFV